MEFDLFNNRMNVHYEINLQGGGKVGLQLYVKQFILVLWFISYYIIFHMNNCKSTFACSCACIPLPATQRSRKD